MSDGVDVSDWQEAPNIAANPAIYELENEALQRDGRLDVALHAIASWDGATLLDIGCGTGFWLPSYAERAGRVVGVEPDKRLLDLARQRIDEGRDVTVLHGSAERLPVTDDSVDIAHARFAYFFGDGADAGLAEVRRVLRPTGTLLAVDNSWYGGDFAELLRSSTEGNATIDPGQTEQWWAERGAQRHEIAGGWEATSRDELERILRIEFPAAVVSDFMSRHQAASISYSFAVYEWKPKT